jgi:hypothetical protein
VKVLSSCPSTAKKKKKEKEKRKVVNPWPGRQGEPGACCLPLAWMYGADIRNRRVF